MITLFSNTLIKPKEFGKIEFKCLNEVSYLQPIRISISAVTEEDHSVRAYIDIDIVNVLIGNNSQFYYKDGKENQEHRANSIFFKDLIVNEWINFSKDRSLVIEMFNYGFDNARVNVCLWCEE